MLRRYAALLFLWTILTSPVHAEAPDPAAPEPIELMTPVQASIIGLVEGVTEYLPVSSTGHLVLVDEFLGLRDPSKMSEEQLTAIEAYEIVVQSGAILAVLLLYATKVRLMIQGLLGRSAEGLRLLQNLIAAFVPAAAVGLLLHSFIKAYLQSVWPVIGALAVGGVAMIVFERTTLAANARRNGQGLESLTPINAFKIGLCQCLALWPGTSRSMTTLMGGMLVGLNAVAAAEFSFLLGLPTLLAATLLKVVKDGPVLITHIGGTPMLFGLVVAALSAALAVRGFVQYLNRRGLAPFGWYRIGLAILMILYFGR